MKVDATRLRYVDGFPWSIFIPYVPHSDFKAKRVYVCIPNPTMDRIQEHNVKVRMHRCLKVHLFPLVHSLPCACTSRRAATVDGTKLKTT